MCGPSLVDDDCVRSTSLVGHCCETFSNDVIRELQHKDYACHNSRLEVMNNIWSGLL